MAPDLAISLYLLALIFACVAFFYASVGLGGTLVIHSALLRTLDADDGPLTGVYEACRTVRAESVSVESGAVVLRAGDEIQCRVELSWRRGAAAQMPMVEVGIPPGAEVVAGGEVLLGAGEIPLTSMDRDGTRDGFDNALVRAVVDATNVPIIASGGVGTLDHLVDGVVEGGADAVLAASIFHFGEHTVAEAKRHMAEAGIPLRPV